MINFLLNCIKIFQHMSNNKSESESESESEFEYEFILGIKFELEKT